MTSWPLRFGLLRTLFSELRLALRLLREPRVPLLMKGLPLLAVAYLLSPLDIVPDIVPLLGQIDDLGFVLLALQAFRRLCPSRVVAFHRGAIVDGRRYTAMSATDDIIDAEWKRV
jgi:uncharacterized membrane protein YkvA (DUF1232 family)